MKKRKTITDLDNKSNPCDGLTTTPKAKEIRNVEFPKPMWTYLWFWMVVLFMVAGITLIVLDMI